MEIRTHLGQYNYSVSSFQKVIDRNMAAITLGGENIDQFHVRACMANDVHGELAIVDIADLTRRSSTCMFAGVPLTSFGVLPYVQRGRTSHLLSAADHMRGEVDKCNEYSG